MRKSLSIGLYGLLAFIGALAITGSLMSYTIVNSGCVGGTYYQSTGASPVWTGKLDTVGSSGADTFKLACGCTPKYITFQEDFYKVSGSPVCTVNLYTSGNGGITYCTAAVTSFTMAPTSTSLNATPVQYEVTGNPYTNYMWTIANSATTTLSWVGSVMVRQ